MVRSRTRLLPTPKLPIWKQDGKLFYTDRRELEYAIEVAGVPGELIRIRMGASYHRLAAALSGARLDCWAVSFLEMGIRPPDERERHDYRKLWEQGAKQPNAE